MAGPGRDMDQRESDDSEVEGRDLDGRREGRHTGPGETGARHEGGGGEREGKEVGGEAPPAAAHSPTMDG
jgi:hypothetical protein